MGINRQRYSPIMRIGSSALFYTIGTGAIWFLLPIIAEKSFNNLMIAASILAVPNVVSLVFNIPLGELSDKTTRKKLILVGLISMVFLGLSLSHLVTIFDFLLFLIVFGFGNLLIIVPSRAYVMEISPTHKTSEYFGIFETLIQLGFIIGPIAGGYLIENQLQDSIINPGTFSSVACLISIFFLIFIKDTITPRENILRCIRSVITSDHIFSRGLKDFKNLHRTGFAILLSTFLFVFMDGVIWAIEPLYVTQGLDTETVGVIMAMFVLPFILFEAPAGWFADKYGKTNVFTIGLIVAGFSFIAFGMTYDPVTLSLTAFAATTGIAIASPAIDGLLTDISSKKARGGIVGVWDMAEDSAYIISPIIGGTIAQLYGINMMFILLGVITLVGLPIFQKLLKP